MITTDDGIRLHVEEVGTGDPIVFAHEFAGHPGSWEPQVRYFSRRYRCITYAARGWPPSEVPEGADRYSQARAADDAAAVIRGLGLPNAHIVGLSMGATMALELAIRHPSLVRSVVAAAGGSGSATDEAGKRRFTAECEAVAARIAKDGLAAVGEVYCEGPARIQYKTKDPRGWAEFKAQFIAGSAKGRANTMAGVIARRRPMFDRREELARLTMPVLVIAGDEDDSTLDQSVFLKRTIPRCGLLIFPKTGHTINLEEPAAFNAAVLDFITAIERDRWSASVSTSGRGYALMPTKP